MELISVTKDNLEQEHICCAISNNKDCQVLSKKNWLNEQFEDGLVFLKGNVRGKCFIEYMPAEKAWAPVEADGYMYINCLWVSGQFKGQGYSNLLLEECIRDSREKGRLGLVVLTSKKKMPYLSDPKFLGYKGFIRADSAEPYFELFYLPFEADAPKPQFKEQVRQPRTEENGFVLYYTRQCPFRQNTFLLSNRRQRRIISHLRQSYLRHPGRPGMLRLRLPHTACSTMVGL